MEEYTGPTLFDIDWFQQSHSNDSDIPYGLRLEFELDRDPQTYDEDELNPFQHTVEHEIECYERRGCMFGPITLTLNYAELAIPSSSLPKEHIRLPSIADPEFVEFADCQASDVILVENYHVFQMLIESKYIQNSGILVMTGSGVPRITARRLLRRMHKELGLRVHFLSDNDTWGYFIYSLLLRGALGPHAYFPWAALNDVNYVGIRAGECAKYGVTEAIRRPWESKWTSRLNAIRRYACFESSVWQAEFDAFENQQYAVNLVDFIDALGGSDEFADRYLADRLVTKN
jgi:DNA topoisomerase VI subunit A